MKYKINKTTIIEETNLKSQLLNSKNLLKATINQNNKLGPDHTTTKKNLESMKKQAIAQQGE